MEVTLNYTCKESLMIGRYPSQGMRGKCLQNIKMILSHLHVQHPATLENNENLFICHISHHNETTHASVTQHEIGMFTFGNPL